MKILLLFPFFLNINANAESNWEKIVSEDYLIKEESTFSTTKRHSLQLLLMPSGNLRIRKIEINPSQSILYIKSKTKDIYALCDNYAKFKTKFSANLVINLFNPDEEVKFNLKNGMSYSIQDLENKININETKLSFF